MKLRANDDEKLKKLLNELPADWLNLTTHRLDIYREEKAKTEFLYELEKLVENDKVSKSSLEFLPTAFDYIRLGHPLSCLLEQVLGEMNNCKVKHVISFASKVMPVMAVLRKNHLENIKTYIAVDDITRSGLDQKRIEKNYGYKFELLNRSEITTIEKEQGAVILSLCQQSFEEPCTVLPQADMTVMSNETLGGVLFIHDSSESSYTEEALHVRRRESAAMTPEDCLKALNGIVKGEKFYDQKKELQSELNVICKSIEENSGSSNQPILANCGLSIQYAILMGLIDNSLREHPEKGILIIIPSNCYGGTNDQARRIANCLPKVEIYDLYVDDGKDMSSSLDLALEEAAKREQVPLVLVEIPTNPRVEVPNFEKLEKVFDKKRCEVSPIFIVDQTFCPNYKILGKNHLLSKVKIISYVSGSKFPSGGECISGYCVANDRAQYLMKDIAEHVELCDNGPTEGQIKILAKQMPSMNQRIIKAFNNTQSFVKYIEDLLPDTKVNFVSKELAKEGFTPSVFSFDLKIKRSEGKLISGKSLNEKLISHMVKSLSGEGKHCVSYGQLRSSYWTIPATSTQGTTREEDKDYIVRVSMPPEIDLPKHKESFSQFIKEIKNQTD